MALLDLTVESSIEELQAIANEVDGVAEQQGWSQKTVFALQVPGAPRLVHAYVYVRPFAKKLLVVGK